MELEFWHARWEKGETGFHQNTFNPYLAYFYGEKGPALDKRHSLRVFVPLCGKSQDMQWLSHNGYAVIGVECSEIAVNEFFQDNKISFQSTRGIEQVKYTSEGDVAGRNKIEIIQGDFFNLTDSDIGYFTDVFDRAALIALPSHLRLKYSEKMAQLQKTGTRTLLVTMTYPQHEMDGPPFSVNEEEVNKIYGNDFEIDMLLKKNILSNEPKFMERGLSELTETVYKLTRK